MALTPEIESLAQQLIEAAEKATQGPWAAFSDESGNGHTNIVGFRNATTCLLSLPGRDKTEPDIAWIALANPANITAVIRGLQEELKRARRVDIRALMEKP